MLEFFFKLFNCVFEIRLIAHQLLFFVYDVLLLLVNYIYKSCIAIASVVYVQVYYLVHFGVVESGIAKITDA